MVTLGFWSCMFVLVFPWLLQALFFVVVSLDVSERSQSLSFTGVSYSGPGRLQAGGLQALSFVVVLMMCFFLHWGIGMWETPLWHICGLSLLFLVLFCNKLLEGMGMQGGFV